MVSFLKSLLCEDGRQLKVSAPLFLAAFGKHPGWDDHIDDIGLATETLVAAKQLLYVQGIGGQIDSGAWEKLDDVQRLPAFKHVFLWRRGEQFLIGRLWSSSDGKGRTRYPMVVCCHCLGISVSWAIEKLLPGLEQIEMACKETSSTDKVIAIMNRYQRNFRDAALGAGSATIDQRVLKEQNIRLFEQFGSGENQQGLVRILYQMRRQMGDYAPGKDTFKSDETAMRPQQIRVPAEVAAPGATLLFWNRFFEPQFDPAMPILFTLPLGEPWLDVTLGEPTDHELFCLRASAKSIPLASDIPYTIETNFTEAATKYLNELQNGTTGSALELPLERTVVETAPKLPKPSRWTKWIGMGIWLVCVSILTATYADLFAAQRYLAPIGSAPQGAAVILTRGIIWRIGILGALCICQGVVSGLSTAPS